MSFQLCACSAQNYRNIAIGQTIFLCNFSNRFSEKITANKYITISFRQRPNKSTDAPAKFSCFIFARYIRFAGKTFCQFIQDKDYFSSATLFC